MAGKIQTLRDIRLLVRRELDGTAEGRELAAMTDIIMLHVFGFASLHELLMSERVPSDDETERVNTICAEIKRGRPLQYATGETCFRQCRIIVNENVLIPRPETEELAECVISDNPGFRGRIADIGTGSGCLAIALAMELEGAQLTAIDISAKALGLARMNSDLNNTRVDFLEGDILEPGFTLPGIFDLIVSNPPYVRECEKKYMNSNVLEHEPHEALFVPDDDPLVFYRAILTKARESLAKGGRVYFEINEALGPRVRDLLEEYGYTGAEILRDINSKDRIAKGRKNV